MGTQSATPTSQPVQRAAQPNGPASRGATFRKAPTMAHGLAEPELQDRPRTRTPLSFTSVPPLAPTATTPPSRIQAKLTVGASGDRFEQEADSMADRVVQRFPAGKSWSNGNAPALQMKCAACHEEEERLRR